MKLVNNKTTDLTTISKTLLTARLIDGFWDRWVSHGVSSEDIASIRPSLITKELWMNGWEELANKTFSKAKNLEQAKQYKESEIMFRTASLYYQLVQWIIPNRIQEKTYWLNVSLCAIERADLLSSIETKYVQMPIENGHCYGRIRIPANPKGVIVIINPLDSTKEELFTYEMDFVNNDFIVVSFDGPGQGQTYTNLGIQGTSGRWANFIDTLIDYTFSMFSSLPIHLFGTSSGASWAIYGSCNQRVSKVIAVSPAFLNEELRLPDYFIERTEYVIKEKSIALPNFNNLLYKQPVYLFHGKKDVMVSKEDIYSLYNKLPNGKCFMEYEDEGHCCNYKLPEIRKLAMEWLQERREKDVI